MSAASTGSAASSRLVLLVAAMVAAAALWYVALPRSPEPEPGIVSGAAEDAATPPEPRHAAPAAAAPHAPHELARVPVSASSPATESLRLTGRVLDPAGASLAGAVVGAFALDGDSIVNPEIIVSERSDVRGAFALALPDQARGRWLALVARSAGMRPASLQLRLDAGALAIRHELRLETGYAIAGRVVRHGLGVAGAVVLLDLRFGTPGVFGIATEAFWIGGRLEEKHARATTSADGTFHLAGLGPHEHRLEVADPEPPPLALQQQVVAPSWGLVLDLSHATPAAWTAPVFGTRFEITGRPY